MAVWFFCWNENVTTSPGFAFWSKDQYWNMMRNEMCTYDKIGLELEDARSTDSNVNLGTANYGDDGEREASDGSKCGKLGCEEHC